MRIIGLTGWAGVGKSTVAKLIKEEAAGTVLIEGFTDRLKVSAMKALGQEGTDEALRKQADILKVFGYVRLWMPGENGSRVLSGREFLQLYGSEAHRDTFGEDVWLDYVLPGWISDVASMLVIPDVRFENEARRIKKHHGEIWGVTRAGVGPVNGHKSELQLDPSLVDVWVENDFGLDELRQRVKVLL